MPPEKIYEYPAEKHQQYRKRQAEKRDYANEICARIDALRQPHYHIVSEEGNRMEETHWYAVTIKIDRSKPEQSATSFYIMSDKELMLLREGLKAFSQSEFLKLYGIFAYADAGNNAKNPFPLPGTMSLAFYGVRIENAELLPGYAPNHNYAVSRGMANIIRMRDLTQQLSRH